MRNIKDEEIQTKKILLRLDLNVPQDGVITDLTRIDKIYPL